MSCDLIPTAIPGEHYQGDVLTVLGDAWDLMIAHPPCTHLAVSGAKHFSRKEREQAEALDFVRALMDAPISKWCIENPVSVISTKIRKPTQIINPYQFGHPERKRTCLWLKNLPKLEETDNVYEEMTWLPDNMQQRIHYMNGKTQQKERSITFQGVADAMADQWTA